MENIFFFVITYVSQKKLFFGANVSSIKNAPIQHLRQILGAKVSTIKYLRMQDLNQSWKAIDKMNTSNMINCGNLGVDMEDLFEAHQDPLGDEGKFFC